MFNATWELGEFQIKGLDWVDGYIVVTLTDYNSDSI